ncbi:MAG: sensor histidine kinase [Hydrogenophaga sp.]|uniref:sensor histidine kinase n=1 Tax=Hydrogenophaga sp. TaxID=1904254 RepID=UPI0040358EBA
MVQSDAVKLRRIAQNLVLNAIRYTRAGGLVLSWEKGGAQDAERWTLRVQDTGPGIGQAKSSELQDALEVATQHADQVVEDNRNDQVTHIHDDDAGVPAPGESPDTYVHGEGIGLSIVKRLCEVLDATVQVESSARGTTFEVLLPVAYD